MRQFKGALNSQWFVRKRFKIIMLKHNIETHQLCGSIGASFSIHSLMRSVLQQVIATLHPHIPRISSLYPMNTLIWDSLKVEYPFISIFPITTPFLGYTWIYRHHFQLHFYSPRRPRTPHLGPHLSQWRENFVLGLRRENDGIQHAS